VRLDWDATSGANGYVVERAGPGEGFTEVGSTGGNTTTFRDRGLAADTEYRYRVRARNAGGVSAPSSTARARTLPEPPAAPGNLQARLSGPRTALVTWSDRSNNEDGFVVERRTGNSGGFAEVARLGAGVTRYEDGDLRAGTTYQYQVRAFNRGGSSAPAGPAEVTTRPGLQSVTVNPARLRSGRAATGEVTLTGVTPVAVTVQLQGSNGAASVPAQVTVPAGSRSASFRIPTRRTKRNINVTVTATLDDEEATARLVLVRSR
jgi:hypothetical protein